MFGKIVYISNTEAHVEVPHDGSLSTNIMNMHVMFEDENKSILGEVEDIDARWIVGARSIGVCGATSTPKWLMEEVAMRARQLLP